MPKLSNLVNHCAATASAISCTPCRTSWRTVRLVSPRPTRPEVTIRGDEERVILAFCAYLDGEGWQVQREVAFVDVYATKGERRLYAEAKGRTTSPGLDVDTMSGQILRRMPPDEVGSAEFAVVLPAVAVSVALRVPARVRRLLGVTVIAVADDGTVTVAEETP
jgi:hypothetical protein